MQRHPRRDLWQDHFIWEGPILRGRTQAGRATIQVLSINRPIAIKLREWLIRAKLFPSH